jgi:hypothetical protein
LASNEARNPVDYRANKGSHCHRPPQCRPPGQLIAMPRIGSNKDKTRKRKHMNESRITCSEYRDVNAHERGKYENVDYAIAMKHTMFTFNSRHNLELRISQKTKGTFYFFIDNRLVLAVF